MKIRHDSVKVRFAFHGYRRLLLIPGMLLCCMLLLSCKKPRAPDYASCEHMGM